MNFFVLTVTDESDMLADSCGREGRLAEQEAAMHKARRRLRAVGKRPTNNVLVSHLQNHDDALTF
jgi:hypothetical protein